MKTNQLMKRDFDGMVVEQRTKDSFLSATDLLAIYNLKSKTKKRIVDFAENKNTKDFLEALVNEVNSNVPNSPHLATDLIIKKKGNNGGTYMHPYLFVKFAMWLSPEFEVKVIKWVYDNLIKVRNEAGNHYLAMCETINKRHEEWTNGKKADPLVYIREANYLKHLAFGYKEKDRNEATESELKLLDALQLANIKLIQQGKGKDERWNTLRDFAAIYS